MGKGICKRTLELVNAASSILKEEHPMTLRQLFYRLVSILIIQNSRADYQRLSRVMTFAREEENINSYWIVDRSKPELIPNVWNNPDHYLRAVANSYRKNYWDDQPCYIEVWLEKDSLTGSVEDVTNELGVTVRTHRGYGSTTKKMEIAKLFDCIYKPIVVFYVGDFDPSGVDIERDLLVKITKYMKTQKDIKMKRIGIVKEDIEKFKLPPLRAKDKDPRAKAFKEKHGIDVVEADALPPSELRGRIKEAVEALINKVLWERKVLVERAEHESIMVLVERYKTMRNKT